MASIVIQLNKFIDYFWSATTPEGRYAGIVAASLVSAVLFLFIFKWLSNQAGIKREKRLIVGYLLHIHLFQNRPGNIIRGIGGVLYHNLRYVMFTLPPLAGMIIPLALITMQIDERCGYAPLEFGDEFVVTAGFDHEKTKVFDIQPVLVSTNDIRPLTPPVRVGEDNNAYWRAEITSHEEGAAILSIRDADNVVGVFPLAVGAPLPRFSTAIHKPGIRAALLHGASGFLPTDSPLKYLKVEYPRARYAFLGFNLDAIELYFLLTLALALVFKPFIRVNI